MEETPKKRKTHTSNAVKYRYEKKAYTKIMLRLRKEEDADILEALEKAPSKNAFIKECIRKNLK